MSKNRRMYQNFYNYPTLPKQTETTPKQTGTVPKPTTSVPASVPKTVPKTVSKKAPKISEIDSAVNSVMNDIDEKDQNRDELHTIIDPSIKFTLNSINVLVGQTGSGKSRAVFREISKLKWVKNNPYHQFIYVTDENNDKTYEKYKDMIPVPILKIGYKEACEKLIELNRMKNGYEKIKASSKNGIELVTEEDKGTMKDYLQIKDFEIPILHTLILFDDATDVFNSPKNELNSIFLRNRHNKFTYFFNVHGFTRTNIPMKVKKNMRSLWYFGGFSKMDFNCSFLQLKSPIEREELYEKYNTLSRRDVLYFDYTENGTVCEIFYLNEGLGRTETLNTIEGLPKPKPKPTTVTQAEKPTVVPAVKPATVETPQASEKNNWFQAYMRYLAAKQQYANQYANQNGTPYGTQGTQGSQTFRKTGPSPSLF
jgi:hypothetical protein